MEPLRVSRRHAWGRPGWTVIATGPHQLPFDLAVEG